MLDIQFIRENKKQVQDAIKNKKIKEKVDVEELLKLHTEYKQVETQVVELRTRRNELSDQIRGSDDSKRQGFIDEATQIKAQLHKLEADLKNKKEKVDKLLLVIPNVTDPKMPVGVSEEDNQVIKKWGEIPEFDFEPKDHVDIGKTLDLIDVEKSAQISGSRFYYLKNEAVLLQFGIIQLVFNTLSNKTLLAEIAKEVGHPSPTIFSPIIPPVLMKPEIMKKMDRLDPIDERYVIPKDGLVLIGSAEHTLGPMHMDEIFEKDDLPVRYVGYSTSFRRESGSHGQDVRGILRVHQFDKLEMETYVSEEQGEVEQKFILAIQEYLVQQLEIPYQLVQICTGDTGKPDYNQFDIECWIPSQKKYRETHTSDYMTDYQARRLNIRYKVGEGKKKFVHMNDATAFAIGRILIAILENNQKKDGSVVVPQVLQDYVGKEVIAPKQDKA